MNIPAFVTRYGLYKTGTTVARLVYSDIEYVWIKQSKKKKKKKKKEKKNLTFVEQTKDGVELLNPSHTSKKKKKKCVCVYIYIYIYIYIKIKQADSWGVVCLEDEIWSLTNQKSGNQTAEFLFPVAWKGPDVWPKSSTSRVYRY